MLIFLCTLLWNDKEERMIFKKHRPFCVHVTYNTMITGLVSNWREDKALTKYKEMFAHIVQLHWCYELMFMRNIGNQVYTQAIKMGYAPCTCISNAAITMFANWGNGGSAIILERVEEKDLMIYHGTPQATVKDIFINQLQQPS